MSAVTAITAQNTLGVTAVAEVPLEVIFDQIEAVVTDIGIDAVKTGMLSSSEIVDCVSSTRPNVSIWHRWLWTLLWSPLQVPNLLQDEAVEKREANQMVTFRQL